MKIRIFLNKQQLCGYPLFILSIIVLNYSQPWLFWSENFLLLKLLSYSCVSFDFCQEIQCLVIYLKTILKPVLIVYSSFFSAEMDPTNFPSRQNVPGLGNTPRKPIAPNQYSKEQFKSFFPCPPSVPKKTVTCSSVAVSHASVFVAGKEHTQKNFPMCTLLFLSHEWP